MGLFSRKPNSAQQAYISSAINQVQISYKQVANSTRPDWFLEAYQKTYESMNYLLEMEKKYPSYFGKHRPSTNMNKIESERAEMEIQFVDRYILGIEKKLLEYSTDRGKRNNFNKEVDKFKYYAGEFLPETVDYFNQLTEERFPEYI